MTKPMPGGPAITVVAAGVNVHETLRPWLEVMAPQVARRDAEVLVAIAASDAFVQTMEQTFGFMQVVVVPSARLVPDLWGAAIARARGGLIAVTITACTPADDWLDAILAAHAKPYAGIGGVIDIGPGAHLVDRAVHLVRYASYLPPAADGPAPEIAGDNGTYKRAALDGLLAVIARQGFWEVEIHRALRARGEALWLDPRIRVSHAHSYSIGSFSRQRFAHGRHFGRTRRRGRSTAARALQAALAPAVPLVMLARIVRTLMLRRRLDPAVVLALPLTTWFLICWAAGEAVGHLRE